MRKGTIRLSHAVGLFLFLYDRTSIIVSIDDFIGESFVHGNAFAFVSGRDHPAESEALLAVEGNFKRHLIGGTTDPAALYFELGPSIFKGTHNEIDRIALGKLLADALECGVNDALGHGALAALHDHVHQVGDERAIVARVRNERTFYSFATT